jgi:hypothetical protein
MTERQSFKSPPFRRIPGKDRNCICMPSSIAIGFSTTLCESRHEGGRARRGNLKWLRRSRACGPANNVDDNTLTDGKVLHAGMLTSRLGPIVAESLEVEYQSSPEFGA